MDIKTNTPPRAYEVRAAEGDASQAIHDCAAVRLEPWEQITLTTGSGAEADVTRTGWGFYLGGSLNDRLARHGLRAALLKGRGGKVFLVAVENDRLDDFNAYLRAWGLEVERWFDPAPENHSP